MSFDAVVIGAGHNGLVAAAYLARAGLRTLVLERSGLIGGAAVTQELIPGFKVSTASYSLSLLRPDIHRDLDLKSHGLVLLPKDPQMFVPLPDGRHFFVWRDASRTVEELANISTRDAEAYPRWNAFWEEAVAALRPLVEDPDPPPLSSVERMLSKSARPDLWRLAIAGSVAETTRAFFESDEVRGAFASQGIVGTAEGPNHPGTAWVFTYHFLGGEISGATGTWAYVLGGMGSVTRAIAQAAEGAGATIRTDAEVTEVLTEAEAVLGVRLSSGEVVESTFVLSNADPIRTSALVPGGFDGEFSDKLASWRTDGCVVKLNAALEELPDFTSLPGTSPGPQHAGTIEISPSIDYLEGAFRESLKGRVSEHPFMEIFLQSVIDPEIAPEGKHVLSAFCQYAPSGLTPADWERLRADAREAIISTIGTFAPNVRDAVIAEEVLGPPDLERIFGLTGGDIFHGSILPEQSFGERFRYRTPIRGFYLCGSGASPGGGVMGAAGRNAAVTLLADLRRW